MVTVGAAGSGEVWASLEPASTTRHSAAHHTGIHSGGAHQGGGGLLLPLILLAVALMVLLAVLGR